MGIKINNLKFSYQRDENFILDDITINSDCRSIAIVGTSGCGKSTLLRLLCGLIKKNRNNLLEGSVFIDDIDASYLIQSNNVGFMFQEDALLPYLNVEENVKFPLKLQKNRDCQTVVDYIEKVGLSADIKKLPRELSGGMRTRVALARTFVTKPSVLFLDEPFTGLDEYWRATLYKELETLRMELNPFTALVTHQIEEALMLSNHIIVLSRNGTVLKDFIIDRPLPRVFSKDPMDGLKSIQIEIKELILNDSDEAYRKNK